MGRPTSRRWLGLCLSTAVGGGVLAACLTATGGSAAFPARAVAVVDAGSFAHHCPPGTPIPDQAFDLGARFDRWHVISRDYTCTPALPRGARVASGPAEPVGYVSVVYGNCTTLSEDGCLPPVEVQSWPECARNPNSYKPAGHAEAARDAELNPSRPIRIPTADWIPAAEFEDGTRVELYSGRTTIVVFANSATIANSASDVVARAARAVAPAAQAAQLRSTAHEPGDASTCHDVL